MNFVKILLNIEKKRYSKMTKVTQLIVNQKDYSQVVAPIIDSGIGFNKETRMGNIIRKMDNNKVLVVWNDTPIAIPNEETSAINFVAIGAEICELNNKA